MKNFLDIQTEKNDSQNILNFKVDTEKLSTTQIRLLKNLHTLAINLLSCSHEEDYFEQSAALLKKAVEVMRYSQFSDQRENLLFVEQAIEYAIDNVSELSWDNINNFDN